MFFFALVCLYAYLFAIDLCKKHFQKRKKKVICCASDYLYTDFSHLRANAPLRSVKKVTEYRAVFQMMYCNT